MPLGGLETGGFVERRFAAEVGRVVLGFACVRVDPLRVVAAEVGAVEGGVRVDPGCDLDRIFQWQRVLHSGASFVDLFYQSGGVRPDGLRWQILTFG